MLNGPIVKGAIKRYTILVTSADKPARTYEIEDMFRTFAKETAEGRYVLEHYGVPTSNGTWGAVADEHGVKATVKGKPVDTGKRGMTAFD